MITPLDFRIQILGGADRPGCVRCSIEIQRPASPRAQLVPPPYESQQPGTVRFVAISDTHTRHGDFAALPNGDVLLHTGDFCNAGTLDEIASFCEFARALPFRRKLLTPGNHDMPCDAAWYEQNWREWHAAPEDPARVAEMLRDAGVEVLSERATVVDGLRVFGSPLQPRQPKSRPQMAFGRTRGAELKAAWARVPDGVDVLLTHTPPAGVLDASEYSMRPLGCEELLRAVQRRVRPALHVFGHVHGGYGAHADARTLFVNAASVTERRGEAGAALNPPLVVDVRVPSGE